MPAFESIQHSTAPVETVWEVLSDHEGMPSWARVKSVELEQQGSPDANGVGAVRVLRSGPIRVVEEITEFDAPKTLAYRMTKGLPIKRWDGRVELAVAGDGTKITWRIDMEPDMPAMGWALKRMARKLCEDLAEGLARQADERRGQGEG
ncbi:MAG: hypothetical protein JJLCMIEE_00760 [Acidimicrobiales bacterium]|nr:MAG: SRPBCC family protein [Actinomycetota bacterium]MBV6507705.1 hypothetical protein [Acidimicrobiales bacterium]RIK07630.1 MAG: hypothetical protein DCC48_03815 [Acidobacteriota bacterium]